MIYIILILPLLKIAVNHEEKKESAKDKSPCHYMEALFGLVYQIQSDQILIVPLSKSNPEIEGI
jgi:hypothetical protein